MTATHEVLTPTVRRTARKSVFWLSMLGITLLVVLIIVLLTRGASGGGRFLSPENAGPTGSMALAEVLRGQGVTVTHATTLVEARAALENNPEASLFVFDLWGVLTGDQLDSLQSDTGFMVLMSPQFDHLDGFVDELAPAGLVEGSLDVDCDAPAVVAAERVTGDGYGYRLIDELPDAAACLDSGTDVVSLIQYPRGDGLVTILGTESAFTNEQIGLAGNAALALWLLGTSDELIWYEANIVDAAVPGAPTIGELTPQWVSAAIVLLGLAIVALALWQGRRFGPLVVENLPVVVRASETMEGRARLYQKSTARLHALDTLRIGAIARLATLCGLGRAATVDEVVTSVSSLTVFGEPWVRGVLVDSVPHTDAQLMTLSDQLLELERHVAARLGRRATTQSPTMPPTTPPQTPTPEDPSAEPGQGE